MSTSAMNLGEPIDPNVIGEASTSAGPERSSKPARAVPPPPSFEGQGGEGLAPGISDISLTPSPSSSSTTTTTGKKPKRTRPPIPHSSLLHPTISSLPNHNASNAHVLTPLRAHYLKKFLVNHQFMDELAIVSDPSIVGSDGIASLGAPFAPPKEQVPGGRQGEMRIKPLPDLPFLKFMFRQFVLTFPFLTSTPDSFWPQKVQPTLSQFLALSLSPSFIPYLDDDPALASDAAKRRKIFDKLEKHMTLLLGSAIKLEGGEEVVRIGQDDLRLLEEDAKRRVGSKGVKAEIEAEHGFEINVIGVRGVQDKGRVRSKNHEDFLVRTSRAGMPDVFVWRRYGDFKRLSEELRVHHPDEEIRSPPPKDKTVVSNSSSHSYHERTPSGSQPQSTRSYLASWIPGTGSSSSPRSSIDADSAAAAAVNDPNSASFDPSLPRTGTADSGYLSGQSSPNLSREKNRLTLRSFLRSLLSSPSIANSPVLRSFLLSGPSTLTNAEEVDARRREDADRLREEGKKTFKREAERRVEELRESIRGLREEMIGKGGIRGVFEVIKTTSDVTALPIEYRQVLEYGRISLASAIFQTFVASDDASTTLLNLKRLHGLMPYFVLKGILKVSNPMAMIRGILELFLARPFGGQSLIQRMFTTSLNDDMRELQDQIDLLAEKIADNDLCEKIKQFVIAPPEIQQIFKRDAEAEGIDIIAVILRSPDVPALSRPQMMRVIRAHRAYSEYKKGKAELEDSDDDEGPSSEEGWLFVDLNHLMKLYARLREKERMVALIFEGSTAELLKDIITIFYAPLAQVYKAASIADSLGDLQAFVNDLIKTVEAVEELGAQDTFLTVQTFIDLVERHEQAFYTFVHKVHSKGSTLFTSLMNWIELFLDFVRDGLPPDSPTKLDLEILLPHSGPERAELLKEVDSIAVYHYKLKVAHEGRVRRKFLREGGKANDEAEGDEEQALVDSIVDNLSFGNTMRGDAAEIADEESSEGEDEYEDASDGEGSSSEETLPSTSAAARQTGSPSALSPSTPLTGPPPPSSPNKKVLGVSIPHRPAVFQKKEVKEANAAYAAANAPGGSAAVTEQRHLPGHPPKGEDGLYSKKEQARHVKRKGKVVIEPPVIRQLPSLLPLFVEMVRPMLLVSTPPVGDPNHL